MKHKINKLYFGILVLFALAFSACSDNDPKELFDDNPSTRIDDQIDLVRNTLLSAKDGWKVTYFTNDIQLGGFTYLIKFLDEATSLQALEDIVPSNIIKAASDNGNMLQVIFKR